MWHSPVRGRRSGSRQSQAVLPAALVFLALGQAALAATVAVTRRPYLQTGTPTSVTVRWRTSTPTDSCVRYGTAPGSLTGKTCKSTSTTEHALRLSGLSPNKQYYYSVGTTAGSLAGGDAAHFFVTAPAVGASEPTRVWVIGDSGTANGNARAVRDAYLTFTGSRYTDVWLMLGDNAYFDGTDAEYQAAVFDMYPALLKQTVLWPTLGNHDGHTAESASQSGPYYTIFTLPRNGEAGGLPSGTEAYYSFDFGNIHFICLDSQDTNRSPSGAMLRWLEEDLADTSQDWLVAFWHHPPYSKGSHDSDYDGQLVQMRQYALPLLEEYGVDLVLAGHSHSYERSVLLDGHYGTSSTLRSAMVKDSGDGREGGDGAYAKPGGFAPHEGAVYAVAGSSGKTEGGALNHPVMVVSLNVLGSLVLDINGGRLDAKFLSNTGAVRDRFTIRKDEDGGGGSGTATSVSFQDGVAPTAAYAGTRDAFIAEAQPGTNFGASTSTLDGDEPSGSGKDRAVILKWTGLTVPAGSTVQSVTVTLNVTDHSGNGTYELYQMKPKWVESDVTWNRYSDAFAWQTPGAKGSYDRGTTVLGTVAANATGKRTFTLNAAGVALVQAWVDSPSSNQGFIIVDGTVADGLDFDSSEASTAGNRPKLTIAYEGD